ncbi:MAG: hypothetical protein M3308_07720 [Actinomycetota bacterium]|nr:hypothetical protein [Actinomycetota bacterium]
MSRIAKVGAVYLAVTVDDDPGAELHRWYAGFPTPPLRKSNCWKGRGGYLVIPGEVRRVASLDGLPGLW